MDDVIAVAGKLGCDWSKVYVAYQWRLSDMQGSTTGWGCRQFPPLKYGEEKEEEEKRGKRRGNDKKKGKLIL